VVAGWQSDFSLLFKLIKISGLLSMGAVQTCASTQQQSDFWWTLLKKIKMDKITSKNTKRALRNRNAKNTTVCSEEANMYFVVGRGVARLNGARGKKQIWHPHSRTWTLSEAYFLYWKRYLWHYWYFSAPHQ